MTATLLLIIEVARYDNIHCTLWEYWILIIYYKNELQRNLFFHTVYLIFI